MHLNYIIFLLLFLVLGCSAPKTKLPDLRESFAFTDSKPFGTSVAFDMLQNAYPEKQIEIGKKDFGENYGWFYDTTSIYMNFSSNYYVTERDAQAILDFVYKGNTAVISSANFDTAFMRKIYCTQSRNDTYKHLKYRANTSTRFNQGLSLSPEKFEYYYYPFANFFPELNGDYARIMGYNENERPNMFVFLWGHGKIIFHAEPRVFSNYFLLTKNNYLYMQELLQMLPESPQNIYWDNFYAKKNYVSNGDKGGSLSALMKYPPLARAFLICLGLLGLYILFNSKRRQRLIPVVKAPENTTIAFAEAIAELYLNNKDNKLIAEKIITYFNEHLRTKYFFTNNINDDTYADVLSRKSGVSIEVTDKLTSAIKKATQTQKISDEDLLILNGLIEKFLKNKS